MNVSPRQIKAARALLGLKQSALDHFAGAPATSTCRFESDHRWCSQFRPAIVAALEERGIRFVPNGVVLERGVQL